MTVVLWMSLWGCVDDYSTDWDGDGVDQGEDCDDNDASRWPGNLETCDGVDNDCDGQADEFLKCDAETDTIDTGDTGPGSTDDTDDTEPPGDTGDSTVPDTITPQLSVGMRDACVIGPDKTLRCWGANLSTKTPEESVWTQVAVGFEFACAIDDAGALTCFGPGAPSGEPTGTFTHVTAGISHACAGDTSGQVTCWGSFASDVSGPASATSGLVDLSAGNRDTCVLDGSTATCWGMYLSTVEGMVSVDGGGGTTCGVKTDKRLYCWGDEFGGNTRNSDPPPGSVYAQVAVGSMHACALDTTGLTVCWGDSSAGQTLAPGTQNFVHVEAGDYVSCGVTAIGEVECWGDDQPYGDLAGGP